MFTIDDKEPSLFDYDGDLKKFWYVGFRMTNPNDPTERKPFQIRGFINYKKKVSERRKVGKGLVLAVKDALEKGWNPFELSFEDWVKSSLKLTVKPKKMGFIDGLRYGLKRKKKILSSKTYGEYENNIGYAEVAAKKLGIHNKPVDQIKRGDIRRVLAQIQEDREWTEHAYNKGLKCLSSPMRELLQDDIIEYNPCSMIDRQHWAEINCFEPPTDKELKIIKETLIEKNLPYYIYILFGYHTGMRPKEIFGLQIKNLNFEDRSFKLVPGDGRTKTKKTRIVPVNKHLWKYIEKMRLENFPPEYYIFSDNFLPGSKRKHRNYSTNEVEFDFPYNGGTKAYLMIKNITSQRRPKYKVFVGITKGQINGSYEDVYNRMGLKLDNHKGFYVNYDLSSDDNSFVELEPGFIYEGAYLGTGRKFVKKLIGVEKMIVQIPVYEEGLVEFYFNVSGLNVKRISGKAPVKRQKDAVYGLSTK